MRALVSDILAFIAARLTERWSDQATRHLQRMTERANSPNADPTAMNTVPSGSEDFCMKGAFAVGGTVTLGVGIEEPPVSDGKPVVVGNVSVAWGSEEPLAVMAGAVVCAESEVLLSSSLDVSFVVGSGGFDVAAGLFVDAGGLSVLVSSCERTVVASRASNRNKSNEKFHRMINYSHDDNIEQGKVVAVLRGSKRAKAEGVAERGAACDNKTRRTGNSAWVVDFRTRPQIFFIFIFFLAQGRQMIPCRKKEIKGSVLQRAGDTGDGRTKKALKERWSQVEHLFRGR